MINQDFKAFFLFMILAGFWGCVAMQKLDSVSLTTARGKKTAPSPLIQTTIKAHLSNNLTDTPAQPPLPMPSYSLVKVSLPDQPKDDIRSPSPLPAITIDPSPIPPSTVHHMTMAQSKVLLSWAGETTVFFPYLEDSQGRLLERSRYDLTWRTDRPSFFSVDQTGKVTALMNSGFAQITVTEKISGLSASAEVTIVRSGEGQRVEATPSPAELLPMVDSFLPAGGAAGELITVKGKRLSSVTAVKFGLIKAPFLLVDDSTLKVTVPNGAVTGSIALVTAVKTIQSGIFTVIPSMNGDLPTFVLGLPLPLAGTNAFIQPPVADIATWKQVMTLAVQPDSNSRAQAYTLADSIGYQAVQFVHTNNTKYFILYEKTGASFRGQGTYVISLQPSKNIVVSVPHPIFEIRTSEEGLTIMLQMQPRVMMIAGTHRCSNCGAASPFAGTTDICNTFCGLPPGLNPYRISDVNQFDANFFQQTHVALRDAQPTWTFVQLHGATPAGLGLDGAAQQLNIILSLATPVVVTPGSLIQQLNTFLDGSVNSGLYPDETLALGGIFNLQAAYIYSGTTNPCIPFTCFTNGKFIHVEQDQAAIDNPQPLINGLQALYP